MSFLFSQPIGVVKTPYYPRGKLRLLERLPPVSYLSTLTEAHSLPVSGIISRCPMHRIQVISDSAGNLSSSSLLLEFIWSESEIQQSIERNQKWSLSGIEPATNFSPRFRIRRAAIPGGNTGVSHVLELIRIPEMYRKLNKQHRNSLVCWDSRHNISCSTRICGSVWKRQVTANIDKRWVLQLNLIAESETCHFYRLMYHAWSRLNKVN